MNSYTMPYTRNHVDAHYTRQKILPSPPRIVKVALRSPYMVVMKRIWDQIHLIWRARNYSNEMTSIPEATQEDLEEICGRIVDNKTPGLDAFKFVCVTFLFMQLVFRIRNVYT